MVSECVKFVTTTTFYRSWLANVSRGELEAKGGKEDRWLNIVVGIKLEMEVFDLEIRPLYQSVLRGYNTNWEGNIFQNGTALLGNSQMTLMLSASTWWSETLSSLL